MEDFISNNEIINRQDDGVIINDLKNKTDEELILENEVLERKLENLLSSRISSV